MKRTAPLIALVFMAQNAAFGGVIGRGPYKVPAVAGLPSWLQPAPLPYVGIQDESPNAMTRMIVVSADENDALSQENASPFHKTLHETAKDLWKTNIINGAELAVIDYLGSGGEGSINSPFFVRGLEDDETSQDAKLSEWHKRRVEKSLAHLADGLRDLQEKHYNPDLLVFDQKFSEYQAGTLSVPGYALYLDSVIPVTTPQLQAFIAASLLESTMDFVEIDQQQSEFLSELILFLDKDGTDQVVRLNKLFKSGLISQVNYHNVILELAKEKQLTLSSYSELNNYVRYVRLCNNINDLALFDEIDAHEQKVQERLAASTSEREIAALAKAFYLMKKLVERRGA